MLNQAGASLRLTGPHPWRNPVNAFDVNNVAPVTALDVLLVINLINAQGAGPLPVPPPATNCPPYWFDVSGDDQLAALDVLMVINWINGQPAAAAGGEGEELSAAAGRSPASGRNGPRGLTGMRGPEQVRAVPAKIPESYTKLHRLFLRGR